MQLFKLGQYVCIKKHKCGVIKKKVLYLLMTLKCKQNKTKLCLKKLLLFTFPLVG